ncbi:MAG: hypothetical protein J5847_06185, partial [Clostridia bacterium]|nr:hypothetical protein [Clostridia bacterium]
MKTMRKTLSIALALLMLLTVCAVPAFAKTTTKNKYDKMIVIGDSVATGFCIFEPDGTQVGKATHGRRIVGSYPDIVCKKLGLKDYYNYTREGLSSIEFRRLFDKTYTPDEEDLVISDSLIEKYAEGAARWEQQKKEIKRDIKKSDLIIVNFGSNDIFAFALRRVYAAMDGTYTTNLDAPKRAALVKADETVQKLLDKGQIYEAWETVFQTALTLDILEATVSVLNKNIYNGAKHFCQNWDPVLDRIHKYNPDAKMVVVSLFNGLEGLYLTNDLKVGDIGKVVLGPAIDVMNIHVKAYNAVHNYYTIVDITDVDHPAWPGALELYQDFDNLSWHLMVNTHPSNQGHKQIAKKVLAVL